MSKVKVHRSNPSLDMTPMVDLAFLLVTFFMLITKFAPEEALIVDTPSSISDFKVPDNNVITISVGNDNRVFYGVSGQGTKEKLLKNMAAKYKLSFTPEESKQFELMPSFGVPVSQLKSFLATSPEKRKAFPQPGVPFDSVRNELADWVLETRRANPEVIIAIKGDQSAEVPTVQRVIEVLQDRKINRFSLITDMENKPFNYKKR